MVVLFEISFRIRVILRLRMLMTINPGSNQILQVVHTWSRDIHANL